MTAPVQQGMTAEQYAAAQAAITEQLAVQVAEITALFRTPGMSLRDWDNFLDLLFPWVEEARQKSAELGRSFFDSQHRAHYPDLEPPRVLRVGYKPQWFREEMFPARKEFIQPGATDHAADMVVLRTMKAVENGGRRQIIRGVEETTLSQQRPVAGWARVATGRETCAFCMMLVSRGPVYMSAESAGLDLDDTSAQQLFERGDQEALDALMTRWHAGCDCKVVPVFNKKNWPGMDAQKRALGIWRKTTRGYSGKDAMNAFRRAIERGDVDINEMSIAA